MIKERHNLDAEPEYLSALRRKIAEQRVPYTGTAELKHRCNLKCVHCYCGDQSSICASAPGELETAQWLKLIDEAASAGCIDFVLSGGEPMLRPDFPAIFERAKTRGMIVTVFTNATLVSDEILDVFSDLPPFLVEVSIYGATAETHDHITQAAGSFERVRRGIDALRARGIKVGLKSVLMTLNCDEFVETEQMAVALGVNWRMDSAIFPCLANEDSGAATNCRGSCAVGSGSAPVDLRVPAVDAARVECARLERAESLRKTHEQFKGVGYGDKLYTCGAGLTGFHLDPYGYLQPCLMASSYRENAVELGFGVAWQRIERIRDVVAPANFECSDCEIQSLCSGCPGLFDLENGNPGVKSEYICSLARHRFDNISNKNETAGAPIS